MGEEMWERWKELQSRVKEIGNKSYEDHLLEVFRNIDLYAGREGLTNEEITGARILKQGVIRRFAHNLPR
jgi:hypothetical protein